MPVKKVRPSQKLNDATWLEIVNMVQRGVPVDKVATLYKVQRSTIYRGLKKRGVDPHDYLRAADEINRDKTREEYIAKVREAKEKGLKIVDWIRDQTVVRISKAQKKDPDTGKTEFGSDMEKDIKVLKDAMAITTQGIANAWKILGLDKEQDADKELPTLPVREMSNEEIEEIRERQDATRFGDDDPELAEEYDDVIEGEDDDGEGVEKDD